MSDAPSPSKNVARSKKRKNERGVALILVLGSIAILTIMLTDLQDQTTSELSAALADRDALKAEYLAKSGINLARLLISTEPLVRQGISFLFIGRTPPQVPVWEFSDRILGAFNDEEGGQQFALLTGTDFSEGKNLGIEGGKFELQIVDEDAKLNINVAARGEANSELRLARQLLALMAGDRYNPMFEQRDRDDNFSDRATVCGAIVDWADADEDLFGCDPTNTAPPTKATEDISYQLLKKPYFRKNAAYDSLEELHLVRGVSDDFWATFVDPEPDKPKKRVVTVWGQGTINVNSANAQTLLATICAYAVPTTKVCNDPLEAEKFLLGVTLVRSFTAGIPLFSSGNDFIAAMQGKGMVGKLLTALAIEPVAFTSTNEASKQVTAESKIFSIYADGIVPGYRRKTHVRVHTVVDFRGAPAPGAPLTGPGGVTGAAAGTGGAPNTAGARTSSAGGSSGAGGASGSTGQDALTNVMAPNPGGTIVYYRME